MQENIKEFKKRLRAIGFKRKSDRVYWYDNNGLFYVVSFKMEGKAVDQIGFEVSHAGMFEDGTPQQRCSPVGGWLGWDGVCGGSPAVVRKENPGADILERTAREFFSYFKAAPDWQAAICVLQKRGWPRFTETPICPDAGGAPVPWFVNDVAGELQAGRGDAVNALFAAHAQRAGFSRMDETGGGFVRQRGEVYECFFIGHDELSTFFSIYPYIWCERFGGGDWPAFSNLNDDRLPAAGWVRSSDVLRGECNIAALLDEVMAFCRRFTTAADWVQYLDAGHASIMVSPEDLAKFRALAKNDARSGQAPAAACNALFEALAALAAQPNCLGMAFVPVPAGTFIMGAAAHDAYALDWERPQREVTISRPFLLGKYPVTQAQWQAVMGENPSGHTGDALPVDNITWEEAQEFIQRLNAKEEKTGQGGKIRHYRLPTEAEWEYACRAGATGMFCCGDDEAALGEYACYSANSDGTPQPVGEKKPNAWGLYDMHGNVEEWVQDWMDGYMVRAVTDPKGPGEGKWRVYRGGAWDGGARFCRCANRSGAVPRQRISGVGMRLACDILEQK